MAKIDLAHFKSLYLKTAREYVEKMKKHSQILLGDLNNTESINELHIASHSLKSQSLVMQYTSLGMLCALIEKILRTVQDGDKSLSQDVLVAMQDAIRMIETSLVRIEKDNKEVDLSYEKEQLESLSGIKVE